MIKKILILILVFSFAFINAQRVYKISVEGSSEKSKLSFLSRRGNDFVSLKEISKILNLNYYQNKETAKVEIKTQGASLKFTGRNQFVIFTDKSSGKSKIYQLPISTRIVGDDIFIPFNYSIKYLNELASVNLKYDDSKKHLAVDNVGTINNYAADIPSEVKSNYDVFKLVAEEKINGIQLRFISSKILNQTSSFIRDNKLIVTINNALIHPPILDDFISLGFIKSAKMDKVSETASQFTFELKRNIDADTDIERRENELIVILQDKNFVSKEINYLNEIDRWKFDVVVIDPGHGGKDPGAIGVSGTREKDINLAVGLKLGKLIEQKMSDVKVEYTRTTDKFVELHKRGKIANENGGKLFISIHCNSLARKPSNVRGFEIYLLRPGRTDEAIKIAEIENSVIELEEDNHKYEELTAENFILVSMAHSSYMRYSEKFSEIMHNELAIHHSLPSRGIKQAGFYVLVGASMPGVLYETGFLSNRKDERYLNTARGQQKIAEGIYNAIVKYRDYYESQMQSEL